MKLQSVEKFHNEVLHVQFSSVSRITFMDDFLDTSKKGTTEITQRSLSVRPCIASRMQDKSTM